MAHKPHKTAYKAFVLFAYTKQGKPQKPLKTRFIQYGVKLALTNQTLKKRGDKRRRLL